MTNVAKHLQRAEAGAGTPSGWRRMGVWAVGHAVDDLYQGLVPACVPYFVLDRHYSYVAAAGLTLAAAMGSSIPQPFFGVAVDRFRLDWLASAGVAIAGIGLGLSGLVRGYLAVWLLILLSGLGVAMFHPSAGRSARAAAGDSATAMSIFAAGGSVGFFLAPVLATPALIAMGVAATVIFIPPAVLIAFVLYRHRSRTMTTATWHVTGTDQWRPFAVLTAIETVRSVTFFGSLTFIELYWIRYLHADRGVAGVALAAFAIGGVGGTVLGGRIADRIGTVRTVQLGTAAAIPLFIALRLIPGPILPLAFAVLAGAALSVPFAVLIKLGQDYLPTRPGTAAGVTLGLAVSIGGLFAPALGLVAERWGPQGVFTILGLAPAAALALGLFLTQPQTPEGTLR